jgi:A/G-specific adenine glycosylase
MATGKRVTDGDRLSAFVRRVLVEGRLHHRDFPWRSTRYPYAILVSEVMLQQTQASRVVPYFESWMAGFPTLEALAAAPLEAVLRAWAGLGYNRRAIALKRTAERLVAAHRESGGSGPASIPCDEASLRGLPGVGPATAAGILAFAYGEHAAYLETNVRTVFLHEWFADASEVPDREIRPLVIEAARIAAALGVDARTWNQALLDYGVHLKRSVPNPSRRSAHHARQSRFEGSRRQVRARVLRMVIAAPGCGTEEVASRLGLEPGGALEILEALEAEGFLIAREDGWSIAG